MFISPLSAPDIPAALVEQAPVAWQEIGGRRIPVAARYTLDGSSLAGFALGTYDPAYPLVIDPRLSTAPTWAAVPTIGATASQ
jgi:hypothetical protein